MLCQHCMQLHDLKCHKLCYGTVCYGISCRFLTPSRAELEAMPFGQRMRFEMVNSFIQVGRPTPVSRCVTIKRRVVWASAVGHDGLFLMTVFLGGHAATCNCA